MFSDIISETSILWVKISSNIKIPYYEGNKLPVYLEHWKYYLCKTHTTEQQKEHEPKMFTILIILIYYI